jgi:ligand-binding SRPBCC domain-containing protein
MKVYRLHRTQNIKTDINTAWDFFSNPANLKVITPPNLGFNITCKVPPKIYPGLIITYTVTPLLGIPMTWVTEITQVDHLKFFCDEQRAGPYKMWHHEHHFKEISGGVEAEDIVSYILPFGPLGRIAHSLVVARQLETIFSYRNKILNERFGTF